MTTPVAPQQESDNVFTRKLGPLPMWAWMGLVLLGAILFHLVQKNRANTTASPSTVNTPGGVDSSLVPQFVNQTFENVTPPAAPSVNVTQTVNGTPVAKPKPPHVTGPGKINVKPGEDFLNISDLKGTYDLFVYSQPGNKLVYTKKHGTAPEVKVPNLQEGHKYYVKVLENGQWITKTVSTGPG